MSAGVWGPVKRRKGLAASRSLALADPDAMRTHLAPAAADFAKSLLEGMRLRERTCMRMYAEIMRYVGAETQIVIAIWQQLGVRDEPEARRLIATARGVDDLDEHGAAELSVKYLDTYRRKFPDRWPEIARSLVGPPPTDGKSGRTNGGGP